MFVDLDSVGLHRREGALKFHQNNIIISGMQERDTYNIIIIIIIYKPFALLN